MCTPYSYLRVFATVLVRGLVGSNNNTSFFNGMNVLDSHFMKGFGSSLGLQLNKFQKLLRYLHLVNNDDEVPAEDEHFDKVFKVRPLVTRLQEKFKDWCFPGKYNALDEGGIPSRHHWLRIFNRSKPNKYNIDIIMACDSSSRFCWEFVVNEGAKKIISESE